jgi:transposase
MLNQQDIAHLSKDEQIQYLLSALHISESQNTNLVNEVNKLSQDLSDLAASTSSKIAELEAAKKEAQAKLESLIEQIKLMNMRHFGSKSEQVIPGQVSLFNDMEFASNPEASEPALDEVLSKRKPRKRGGKPTIDFSKFETVIVEHVIEDTERTCPECGCELKEMNVEITRRVRIVPAHLVVEEHHRHVYICNECCQDNAKGEDVKSVIVRAPQPNPPIPGSFASPSLIAYIINAKYVNSMPLYRIENDFKSLGINLSRQTQSNWVMNVYERWLHKIHERMKAELLSHDLAHADETVVQVLKEPNREAKQKSRMWVFCSAECDIPVTIYEYHETRRKGVAQEFFAGWKGTLTTDGYKPYFNLGIEGVRNTACGVHIRRYFAQIVKKAGGDEKAAATDSVALEARKRIDCMFAVDSKFDGMDAESRKAARDKELRPLMEEFLPWATAMRAKASPRLALYKALDYAITYWPYFMNVLEDGRLELSNNIAERSVKPFVIGRKNWLFSDTPRGAHASAAIYSIVITAANNGLNPRLYIEWLLEEMPNIKDLSDALIDSLLPWSDKVPETCKLSEAAASKGMLHKDNPLLDVDSNILDDEMKNNEEEF